MPTVTIGPAVGRHHVVPAVGPEHYERYAVSTPVGLHVNENRAWAQALRDQPAAAAAIGTPVSTYVLSPDRAKHVHC